jgi:hypothetical protein
VRTVRELFDMMSGAREQAFQRVNQFRRPGSGPAPGQWQGAGSAGDDDYDHYNVEGSDPQLRGNRGRNQGQRGRDFDFGSGGDNPLDDIGGAVLGAAFGFAGRAIGRRMKKAFEEKVVPTMEAKAAQAQQQWEQSKAEQDAIVARYPELRGCTKDQVVFLDAGVRTVPVSEIKLPGHPGPGRLHRGATPLSVTAPPGRHRAVLATRQRDLGR